MVSVCAGGNRPWLVWMQLTLCVRSPQARWFGLQLSVLQSVVSMSCSNAKETFCLVEQALLKPKKFPLTVVILVDEIGVYCQVWTPCPTCAVSACGRYTWLGCTVPTLNQKRKRSAKPWCVSLLRPQLLPERVWALQHLLSTELRTLYSLSVSLDLQGHWRGWTSGWAGTKRQLTAEMSAVCPGPTGVPSPTANIYFCPWSQQLQAGTHPGRRSINQEGIYFYGVNPDVKQTNLLKSDMAPFLVNYLQEFLIKDPSQKSISKMYFICHTDGFESRFQNLSLNQACGKKYPHTMASS